MSYRPEFERYAEHVRKELLPKLKDSNAFISITPMNAKEVDVKFAMEIGLAIMLDKPIVAIIRPGTKIPEKFSRVVDRFVEVEDISDPDSKKRLMQAVEEILELKNG